MQWSRTEINLCSHLVNIEFSNWLPWDLMIKAEKYLGQSARHEVVRYGDNTEEAE